MGILRGLAVLGAVGIGAALHSVYDPFLRDFRPLLELNTTTPSDQNDERERGAPWRQQHVSNDGNGNDEDEDIEVILKSLTLREKAGQMTQLDIAWVMNGDEREPARALNREAVIEYAKMGIGSILNSPFPRKNISRTDWTAAEWRNITDQIKAIYREYSKTPMIYGIDTIHGASFVRNATLFGQPLSAASSFNTDLVYKMGQIEAKDTLAGGIPWVFSPVLGIAVQPKWARVYETFGEDPYLASQMGAAIIKGIQSTGKVAACMKHFIGYSNPYNGLDRTDNIITDFDLVNYFAPSFLAATQAGVKTAMETYVSVNGYPVIASHKLLTDLLRHDMGFKGMMVSDYSEIDRLYFEHHLVPNVSEADRVVLNATSLDMNMGPNPHHFMDHIEEFVAKGHVSEARIDESVRRILALKKELGLLKEHTGQVDTDLPSPESVGSAEDQQVALDLARESIILLENKDNVLPLSLETSDDTTIFLTGPASNNKGYMCSGWSVWWQGSSNSSVFPHGLTLKEALLDKTSKSPHFQVEHRDVVDVDGHFTHEAMQEALAIAARSKYTIVTLGEGNYAEKAGDIDDLSLPAGQRHYLRALTKIKTTTVILVLITGRPRILHGAHKNAKAILASFFPCEQGGQAIADVLFGDVNPSAKMPIRYPKHSGNAMPYYHRLSTVCNPWDECEVEWEFSHGLSYTQFNYSLVLPEREEDPVGVRVTNIGKRAGKDVLFIFTAQPHRRVSVPERIMLKHFYKVDLKPGESTVVNVTVTDADFSYYIPQIGRGFHAQYDDDVQHIMFYGGGSTRTTKDAHPRNHNLSYPLPLRGEVSQTHS